MKHDALENKREACTIRKRNFSTFRNLDLEIWDDRSHYNGEDFRQRLKFWSDQSRIFKGIEFF